MALRILLVTFAALIDLLEFVIELALTALGSTLAGAAAGCAAGSTIAGQVGCTVGAFLGSALGFIAQGTGAGEAAGFILGYILDITLTFSFGMMLIVFLILSGNFKGLQTLYTLLAKLVPFLGLAPAWSVYAWRSTKKSPVTLKAARALATGLSGAKTAAPHDYEPQTA